MVAWRGNRRNRALQGAAWPTGSAPFIDHRWRSPPRLAPPSPLHRDPCRSAGVGAGRGGPPGPPWTTAARPDGPTGRGPDGAQRDPEKGKVRAARRRAGVGEGGQGRQRHGVATLRSLQAACLPSCLPAGLSVCLSICVSVGGSLVGGRGGLSPGPGTRKRVGTRPPREPAPPRSPEVPAQPARQRTGRRHRNL